jgi:hypothetical protein
MKLHVLPCFVFALCIFVGKAVKAQGVQIEVDSSLIHQHYEYISFTPLTGVGVSIPFHAGGGEIGVSFPYTSTDANTGIKTNGIFKSNPGTMVSNKTKPYWVAFGLEAGSLKHFFTEDASVGTGAKFASVLVSVGYGFMWYFNGFGEHEKNNTNKKFVFKASLSIATEYVGSTLMGTIDNTNQTIDVLGYTAKPTWDETTTDDDGNSYTDTYQAKNLTVSYLQFEGSLLPKISIGNNPYRGGKVLSRYARAFLPRKRKVLFQQRKRQILWNLSLGYNLPFSNEGEIRLYQNDGSKKSNEVANSINLNTPGVNFMYNGKQTTFTPLRSSGLLLSFTVSIGGSRYYTYY